GRSRWLSRSTSAGERRDPVTGVMAPTVPGASPRRRAAGRRRGRSVVVTRTWRGGRLGPGLAPGLRDPLRIGAWRTAKDRRHGRLRLVALRRSGRDVLDGPVAASPYSPASTPPRARVSRPPGVASAARNARPASGARALASSAAAYASRA